MLLLLYSIETWGMNIGDEYATHISCIQRSFYVLYMFTRRMNMRDILGHIRKYCMYYIDEYATHCIVLSSSFRMPQNHSLQKSFYM
jgi:hypothetical protein